MPDSKHLILCVHLHKGNSQAHFASKHHEGLVKAEKIFLVVNGLKVYLTRFVPHRCAFPGQIGKKKGLVLYVYFTLFGYSSITILVSLCRIFNSHKIFEKAESCCPTMSWVCCFVEIFRLCGTNSVFEMRPNQSSFLANLCMELY